MIEVIIHYINHVNVMYLESTHSHHTHDTLSSQFHATYHAYLPAHTCYSNMSKASVLILVG